MKQAVCTQLVDKRSENETTYCNGHTVNTWLTPSLLSLQYQSIVDLRSYLQVQLNQLRINHQCHIDAPVLDLRFFTSFMLVTMVPALVRYPSRVTLPLPRFF